MIFRRKKDDLLHDGITEFKPRPGEEPDEDGYYWRSKTMTINYQIKEGWTERRALSEWDQRKCELLAKWSRRSKEELEYIKRMRELK